MGRFHINTARALLTLVLTVISFGMQAGNDTAQPKDSVGNKNGVGAIFPDSRLPEFSARHFTWGAEVGSSVDMTGNNLTTFDANLLCGYKNSLFQIAGVGVGVHRSISNSTAFVPIFAVLRTSFRTKPSNVFFNFKAGYSFNTLSDSRAKGGFLLYTGVGVNLKQTHKLTSYIILNYGFFHINQRQVADLSLDINHVDFAQLIFGISF